MENKMTFQDENNQLLQSIINPYYYFWKLDKDKQYEFNKNINGNITFEIFVTPRCNQACSYCYLVKHGKDLYPEDCLDEDMILHNLDILLKYCLESGFRFPKFDIFSGEILGTSLGNKVLTKIIDYVKKGLQIDMVVIPSNCSFIYSDAATKFIQSCIDTANEYGCRICISASVDGKLIETKTRNFCAGKEVSEKARTDMFYDRLFNFLKKNNFGVHPMVSALSVKYWPEQYDWWVDILKNRLERDSLYEAAMFLEVRDNNWTDEAIKDYIVFLNHMMDVDIKEDWSGKEAEFIDFITPDRNTSLLGDRPSYKGYGTNYVPYKIPHKVMTLGCSAQTSFSVRLGDLAIYPCHRLSYEKFVYGKYVVENDKIVGIKAKNVLLANRIIGQSTKGMMGCNSCVIDDFCIRGCYGAQYENSKEIFYPCDTVCKFDKIRLLFIYEKIKYIYDKYNLKDKIIIDFEKNGLQKAINAILEENDMEKWRDEICALIK